MRRFPTHEASSTKSGNLIPGAFAFAYDIHRGQHRKGSSIPYITHAMAVAALVGEFGGSEEQVAAALLHDTVEDGEGYKTLHLLRDAFGGHIAGLVEACSDAFVHPKPPWRERKERFIEQTKTASPEVKLIVAADKLHNASTTLRDVRTAGNAIWDRFNGGRDGSLWVYDEMLRALSLDWDQPTLRHLEDASATLHKAAGDADSPRP